MTARWNYFGGRCWMCFAVAREFDHVIPLSRGGTNWPSNLRPACAPCNLKKWAHLVHKETPMAITSASFTPERRGIPASDNYGMGMAKNVDAAPAEGTSAQSQIAAYEHTPRHFAGELPQTTGAGAGTIRKGGRGGR